MKQVCYCIAALLFGFQLLLPVSLVRAQDGNFRYIRADELRDHSGYCFDASRCALRKPGDSWTVDKTCERATCHIALNGTLVEKRTRCDDVAPIFSEECYIVRVEGKPFPHCCPRMFCNDKPISLIFLK